MKLVIAQLNFKVGDVEGNASKILNAYQSVKNNDGLIVFSELALTAYYPQDLLYRDGLFKRQKSALEKIMAATQGNACAIVLGYVAKNDQSTGKGLFNALGLFSDGRQLFEYHKRLLPTYNVYDEARHFEAGHTNNTLRFRGLMLGFLICEDAWDEVDSIDYAQSPVGELEGQQLDLVISINASPSNLGKLAERQSIIRRVAQKTFAPVVYVNQVGGNDELVYDGASFVVTRDATLAVQMKAFQEQVQSVELASINQNEIQPHVGPECELFFEQTVLGVRDYIQKCGFKYIVVGSSGGIDSAVCLAVCTEAVGCDQVTGITMPSHFSSLGSVNDSVELCDNLGVSLLQSSIAPAFALAVKEFEAMTGDSPTRLTQENMQARIRGRKLMEYSNHYSAMVVSTGNKSEMSVGYATLYGDMNGGINPLGDLYKMDVYALAHYINERARRVLIPDAIINKPPSAELSENQQDSDTLPDYPLLDAILKLYIEGDLLDGNETIVCQERIDSSGISAEGIINIQQMVDRAEFKRRQAPPIIRVQKRSFGMGRWLPVAARYR